MMNNSNLNIVVIDDHLKETDPLLVHLKLNFKEANIILKTNAQEGLSYVLDNLNNKMIVLLDYDLGVNETATRIFTEIRKKTSLLYVIIITAKLINDINRDELVTYINQDALAIVDKTVSVDERMSVIEKAIHSLDVRVDCILEQWIANQSEDEQNEPYLTTNSGQTYTLKNILTQIRQGTEFGKRMERKILLLAVDLLTRGKKQIDD